ncbi:glycoside hydrolase family 13 protein [Nonomuraea sp. NPDC050536]|uniref:glycoside hydrolase family 13 protein n=1 Tax=Nonomuraea sp. NPDC050536 TaxID=3364366 RepID=UPI0037CC16AF
MSHQEWWRDAVVYQIYPRSFADADANGQGDLAGIRARLPYLVELGVDAVWLTPFYPSPMADGGYDVADFCDVDPRFGTLGDFDALVADAAEHGIRVIVDIVPNHCSAEHPWFKQALAAEPGSPARERFIFRDEPNNWQSMFGGPAWTQVEDGQWYLHLFDSSQPDWNWRHPDVPALFEDVLRFWLDRGVAGFRVDVAGAMFKDAALPDLPPGTPPDAEPSPYLHQPETLAEHRRWRKILDSYGDRVAILEHWSDNPEIMAPYLGDGQLQQVFNFTLMSTPWSATDWRAAIESSVAITASMPITAPWVLENHDAPRLATRLGVDQSIIRNPTEEALRGEIDIDRTRGLRRARAAALIQLALPGSAYVYQGQELGLHEVLDIPAERREDPIFTRTGGAIFGRDGCRVPLPWSGDAPPYGFADHPVRTWLPQPGDWARQTVAAQSADPGSMLNLYRTAVRLRRAHFGSAPDLAFFDAGEGTLAFTRGPGFALVANLGQEAVALPAHTGVLLASGPLEGDLLPADTAVWVSR